MSIRRRPLVAAGLLLGGPLLTFLVLVLVASPERSDDPALLSERTAAAIGEAHGAGAALRAPMNLTRAEEEYREGLMERRRQELRPGPLRAFRQAREFFEQSVSHGKVAADIASHSTERERLAGMRAVGRAHGALAPLERVEDHIWLAPETRVRLQRARTLVSEGSSLIARGAYEGGARRAGQGHVEAQGVAKTLLGLTSRYADERQLAVWRIWIADTMAWSASTGKAAIIVDKDQHRLTLYEKGRAVRSYAVDLGWNNVADKRRQGDGATPEGHYRITEMKGRGRSRHHKALLLDYPNRDDLANLAELKRTGAVPSNTHVGGLIEIHGDGGRGRDWTDGCVAITNADIDELFARVSLNTPVTIVGSREGDGVFAGVARRLEQ